LSDSGDDCPIEPFDAHCCYMGSILCQTWLSRHSFVIFDIRALWRSGLSVGVPGCQKLQMSDDLTRSGTGCFTAVPTWQQWASKGFNSGLLHRRVWPIDFYDAQGSESGATQCRSNCFELSTVDGCTYCLAMETREELLQLEKAWYKATYIAVKHLAVSIRYLDYCNTASMTRCCSLFWFRFWLHLFRSTFISYSLVL